MMPIHRLERIGLACWKEQGMGSKILLISANCCTAPDPVFPLGLTCLSAALRRAGHECVWLDCLANSQQFAEILSGSHADFVGISLRNIDDVLIGKQETFFQNLPALTARVRQELSCPIILGGSGFSIFPERLLQLAEADFGVVGEGEDALPALLAALSSGADYQTIPGLVFRKNGKTVINPPVASMTTCTFGEADFPEPLTAHYLQTSGMLNLQTQRGCAFQCCYCTYPLIEGRLHRRRPPELIADDFARLERRGARYAFVTDSVFNSSVRHVTEVCEALLRRNLKLRWGCFLRPQGLTRDLMRLMARAGLAHIEFGSDSFCDEVLAAYHKNFTFEDILIASELARQAEVEFCHFLIAGGPGETRATLTAGFENSQKLQDGVVLAVIGMRIYPGTGLYAQAIAESIIGPETNLLAPAYYLAPGLSLEEISLKLREFAQQSPRWLSGTPSPAFQTLIARLRQRGVVGPLWSYFSMAQRLRPQELTGMGA
jgi:radical SAM superfamily enzyme YgiQ (UPF0313 family)